MEDSQTYSIEIISKLLMLSERRCQQLVNDGVIPKQDRGQYDLVKSVQGYVKFLRERAFGGVGNTDMHSEKTRLVIAQANIAEMNDAEMRGDLVRTDEVRRAIFTSARGVRNAFQTVADRLALPIAGESDHRAIHEIIENEISAILRSMDKDFDALVPEPKQDEQDEQKTNPQV